FEAELGPGLDDLVAQRRLVRGARGEERTASAVKFVGAALPVLGALEIGQHSIPGPAAIAELPPMVEILGLAADIDHAVDRAGAAEHAAARVEDGAAVDARIGFGGEAAGDRRMVEQLHIAGRDMDERVAIPPGGL